MSDKNRSFRFNAKLDNTGVLSLPEELLKELKAAGVDRVKVTLETGFQKVFDDLNISSEKVDKISSIQELPKEIVAEFFKSKSSVYDKSFLNRMKSYA